jgi:predicted porin
MDKKHTARLAAAATLALAGPAMAQITLIPAPAPQQAAQAQPAPAAAPQAPGTPAGPASNAPPLLEVYGLIDAFLTSGHYGKGTVTSLDSSGSRATRFGFRGGREVTPGLTIEYNLEAGFNLDQGSQPDSTRIFNRQSYIGLKSDYGTFRFGRMNTMQFVMLGKYDAMDATTQASPLLNLAPFVPRYGNVIAYISPKMLDAVTVQAQYGLGEASDGSHKNDNWHLSAEYEKGPIGLGTTHEEIKDATGLITTKYTLAGGSYDFGSFRVFGGYHVAKVTDGSRDARTWTLSGLYRLTKQDWFSLAYGKVNDRTAANNDASEAGFLYQHFFDPTTVAYFAVSRIDNLNKATFTLNGAAVAGTPVAYAGADPKAIQLGIRYSF